MCGIEFQNLKYFSKISFPKEYYDRFLHWWEKHAEKVFLPKTGVAILLTITSN